MDLYFDRFDGTAAVARGFPRLLRRNLRAKTSRSSSAGTTQAGTPKLSRSARIPTHAASQRYTVDFEQSTAPPTAGQPAKEALVIPVALRARARRRRGGGADGRFRAPGERRRAAPDGAQPDGDASTDVGVAAGAVDQPRLLRAGERPCSSRRRRTSPISPATTATRSARWQAINAYAMRVLVGAVGAVRGGGQVTRRRRTRRCCSISTAVDESLRARLPRRRRSALPGETDIARELGSDIDPDAIRAAREAGAGARSRRRRQAPVHAAPGRPSRTRDPTVPDADSAGRRALRHAATVYLSVAEACSDARGRGLRGGRQHDRPSAIR